MPECQTFDVRFVNNRPVPRRFQRPVVSPDKRRVCHDASQHAGSAVAAVEREVFVAMPNTISKMCVLPPQPMLDLFGIWIEKELMRVEPQPFVRFIGTIDSIAVKQPRTSLWQKTVPDLVGLFPKLDSMNFPVAGRTKKTQLDFLRVLG